MVIEVAENFQHTGIIMEKFYENPNDKGYYIRKVTHAPKFVILDCVVCISIQEIFLESVLTRSAQLVVIDGLIVLRREKNEMQQQ